MTSVKAQTKKTSPRSVLDTIRSWGASPRVANAKDATVTLNQSYVAFDDEFEVPWQGSGQNRVQKEKKQEKKKDASKKKVASQPMAVKEPWIVDKIKFLSLKGLLEKATNAEDFIVAKDKHIEKIVAMAKDPEGGKAICKYLDHVLKACSKGSLTSAEKSIKIIKVCFVLHSIMKKGTAQAYQNVIGNYPDIFDLPQIALPKSIPASCVEARMAISYAAFLNIRVRLRQQDSIEAYKQGKSQIFSSYALTGISVKDLFEKGVSCRFHRKRDSSTFFPRDTIHWFQLHIIGDLIAQAERFSEEAEGLTDEGDDFQKLLMGRKKQLVAWAERMQASRFLSDSEYFQLKAIERSLKKPVVVATPAPLIQLESLI
jgi:hypothetical protein